MKNYRYLLLMLFGASFAFNPVSAASDDQNGGRDEFFQSLLRLPNFPYFFDLQGESNTQTPLVPKKPSGEKPFKCQFEGCNAAFARSDNLTAHTRRHTGEKPFKCTFEDCSAAFARKSHLTSHTRIHTGEKPFKCRFEDCSAAFARSDNLTAHTRRHTGERPFKCTVENCTAAFVNRNSLTRHTKTKHTTYGANQVASEPFDGSKFDTLFDVSNLEDVSNNVSNDADTADTNDQPSGNHWMVSGDVNLGDVNLTENPPSNPQTLSDPNKPFKCEFEGCGASFTASYHLTAHTRRHTGEKPFKCRFEGCGAAFAASYHLTAHTRIHAGEKPFKCEFEGCGAAFAQGGLLTVHKRIHTGEKPFKCEFEGCGAAFARSGLLKAHTRTKHTTYGANQGASEPFDGSQLGLLNDFFLVGTSLIHQGLNDAGTEDLSAGFA